MTVNWRPLRWALIVLIFSSCNHLPPAEHAVRYIPLPSPLDRADAEFSGLTWCGDQLILLPQFPNREGQSEEHGVLYMIHRHAISAVIDGHSNASPLVQTMVFDDQALRQKFARFEGYEAVVCEGEKLWLSIETEQEHGFVSYLVAANINWSTSSPKIVVDVNSLVKVTSQSGLNNLGEEALVVHEQTLYSIHEVNALPFSDQPMAHMLRLSDGGQDQLPIDALPYRLTDATNADANGKFWAINYRYEGDTIFNNQIDTQAQRFGIGATHKKENNVERLVEYQITDNHVHRTHRAPIQLILSNEQGRNWEGIVRWDEHSFLLITDKFPKTYFAYVSFHR